MKNLFALLSLCTALVLPTLSYSQVMLNEIDDFGVITAIEHAGDDRLFVVEKSGVISIIENGVTLPTPFLDIDTRVRSGSFDERGLLGLAFHPNYPATDVFYVCYTNNSSNSVISRFDLSTGNSNIADSTSEDILLTVTQPNSNHNGGQLKFGPDGYLYAGFGDGGGANDLDCNSQNRSTLLGKLLRLDVDQNFAAPPYYGIPASNPFINEGDPMNKAFGLGLRNPWRFSFDRSTGDLWLSDVGQNAREEINMVPQGDAGGQNFGWKIMEGTNCFGTGNCLAGIPACNSPALTLPVFEYAHTSGGEGRGSITGGYVYRGTMAPSLAGSYIFADYLSGEIMSIDALSPTVLDVIIDSPLDITTFGEDNNGELYVAVGDFSGNDMSVFRLEEPVSASTGDVWLTFD